MVSRWVRFHLCGGNHPSGFSVINPLGAKHDIPLGKLASRHHFLSVTLFNICVILGYTFLKTLFGHSIAWTTMCLFIVSPIGTQCVAWISGLGYPMSLFWIFLTLNYVIHNEFGIISLFIFSLMNIMAINALFVALALPAILVFLGLYEFAILSTFISALMGFRIVKATIKLRADEFKKQDMGRLTNIKGRRFIVAVKTVFYYLELFLWPSKLGLYHEWGNNISPILEKDDKRFWLGLIATGGLVAIFFMTPSFLVKFGILWFFSFIFIFLNWITIQQFVTERYLWIPSIGLYLIAASVLQAYPPLAYLIGGILLCRTWTHLPTYDDELRFYLSNTWNYQKSETALANLGCTWIRLGNVGSALDAWHASHKANPDYDVPLANLYFHHRSSAMLDIEHGNYESAIGKLKSSFQYIDACRKCTVQHFKDDWKKEFDSVSAWIANPLVLVVSEKKRLTELRETLNKRFNDPNEKDKPGVGISLDHIAQRMAHIESLLANAPKDKIPSIETVEAVKLTLPGQQK